MAWNTWLAGGLLAGGIALAAGCRPASDPGAAAYRQGLQALDDGAYPRAVRHFQEAAAHVTDPAARALNLNGLGLAWWRSGQKENALRAFTEATRANPRLAEPIFNQGVVLLEAGQEASAMVCFEKTALVDAADTRALEYLGALYRRRGQYDDARRVLTEALKRAPRAPAVLTSLAVLALRTNAVETAVAGFQQALEHDARYAPAVFNLAAVHQRHLQRREQAEAYYRDYLNIVSEGPFADRARAALAELAAAGSNPPAREAVAAPAPATGVAVVEGTPAPKPPETATVPAAPAEGAVTYDSLMLTARGMHREGRHDASLNYFLRAAREAARSGKTEGREAALREAVIVHPADARAQYAWGAFCLEGRRVDEALAALTRTVELNTNYYEAYGALSEAAVATGDTDAAVVALRQADRLRPETPDALWQLAQLYDRHLGLSEAALQSYKQFIARFSREPRADEARERIKALRDTGKKNKSRWFSR